MKKLIIVASMLLAFAARAGDVLMASNGQDSVRLYDTPCMALAVLLQLAPKFQDKMRKAEAIVGGTPFMACWIVDGDSAHLLYEDGDQGLIPLADFKVDAGA